MPIQLLPASAAAFAPRSSVNVVLASKAEPWLTQTLKRVNRVKRPLNSVQQHTRCLTDTLSGADAIWSLCSIMVPKAPDSELTKDSNPLVEAIFNYQLIHIDAYVVHVDMVSQHEVAFKLTPESIQALVDYHKDIYSVDVAATTWDWPDKDAQLKKLQDDFVHAVNRYVFRTGARALEGMEEEGAGELLDGRGDHVKAAIMALFHPLLPPPPRIVDIVHPAPILPTSPASSAWWPSAQILHSQPALNDSWKTVASSPSPTLPTCGETQQPPYWATIGLEAVQLPSPTPSPPFSQPFHSTSLYYSSPQACAPIPALPLPSMIAQQCGSSALHAGFGTGFGWDNGFAPQYAAYT